MYEREREREKVNANLSVGINKPIAKFRKILQLGGSWNIHKLNAKEERCHLVIIIINKSAGQMQVSVLHAFCACAL